MRTHYQFRNVLPLALCALALLLSSRHALAQSTDAVALPKKIVLNGTTPIPGSPNDTIKFTVTQQKPPNPTKDTTIDKQLQYWFEMKLCRKDTTDTSSVSFVICTMLNVNQPKKEMKKIIASLSGRKWTCREDGTTEWYPNFHLGCHQVTMKKNGEMKTLIDTTVTFPKPFTEAEIAATYTDIAKPCPDGFDSTCKDLIGPDKFLIPGDGLFPGDTSGTSSYWIQNGGKPYHPDSGRGTVITDTLRGDTLIPDTTRRDTTRRDTLPGGMIAYEQIFPTGNMYTMGPFEEPFQSLLQGYVTNAPIGAEITLIFPPSTGGGTHTYQVTSDTTFVSVPHVISHALMEDLDEHTHFIVRYPHTSEFIDPNRSMVFKADVIAQNDTYFPDGKPLFLKGQWMHGVLLQFIDDRHAPMVAFQTLEPIDDDPHTYLLRVGAIDNGTMASSALFRHRINGIRQPDVVIDFAKPSMAGDTVLFSTKLGSILKGGVVDSCEIYLKDVSGNVSRTLVPDFAVASAPSITADAGVSLGDARPNPFHGGAEISFTTTRREHVTLEVYDVTGHPVARLVNGIRDAGSHTATFDAASLGLPAGVYYYRLQAGMFRQTKRMIYVGEVGR